MAPHDGRKVYGPIAPWSHDGSMGIVYLNTYTNWSHKNQGFMQGIKYTHSHWSYWFLHVDILTRKTQVYDIVWMDYICIDEFQMIHQPKLREVFLTQPMDHQNKSLNFIFPTKYVIPKSLKFSHWPSKVLLRCFKLHYLSHGLVWLAKKVVHYPVSPTWVSSCCVWSCWWLGQSPAESGHWPQH